MKPSKEVASFTNELHFENDDLYKGYVKTIPGGQFYKGTLLQGFMLYKHTLKRLPSLKMRDDDVVVCSYPKSGTTWTEEIVSLIKYDGNQEKVLKSKLHWRVIHMEVGRPFFHIRYMNNLKSPRLFATHLPLELIPTQLQQGKGKVIYVCRNPKDNAVSYFYHHKIAKFLGGFNGSFDDFTTLYMRGQLVHGSWFKHVLDFWKWKQSGQGNVLWLHYEDMKKDLRGTVLKICDFMGKDLPDEAIDRIVEHCSFDKMKHNTKVNREGIPVPAFDLKEHKFMRKGIIGDWQNHFSAKASEMLDKMYEDQMQGTGLKFQFLPDDELDGLESEKLDNDDENNAKDDKIEVRL